MASGDNTPDLDYASTDALTLSGGSILDAAGNAAVLALPDPGSSNDGLASKDITIDYVAQQPANAVINTSGVTTLTAASAIPGDTVQWEVMAPGTTTFSPVSDSGVYSGATNSALTITDATSNMDWGQYEAVFTDAAGEVTTNAVTLGDYAVTPDQNSYSFATAKTAGFTLTTTPAIAAANETLTYTVVDNANGDNVHATSIPVTSTSQDIPVDLSSFTAAGQIVFTVYLTDASNNEGDWVQAYANLESTAPAAFTIAPTFPTLNTFSAADAGFTFSGAKVGDQIGYTVTSDGTPTSSQQSSITGNAGTVSEAGQTVNLDLSKLAPGNLTYTVTLTNPDGNSTSATATGTLASTFTVTPDTVVSGQPGEFKSAGGFTLGDAEVGATYNYTFTDSNQKTVTGSDKVTSPDEDITPIDLSSLADGPVTLSVTLTDPPGNTSDPVSPTTTMTIDPTAPTAVELSTSVVPSDAALGTQVALLQTVSAQAGTYGYSLVDSTDYPDDNAFTISDNQLLTSANFTSSGQSSYTILVQSTDQSPNSQGTSIQQQFVITVSDTDPITPTVSLDLSNPTVASNAAVGTEVGSLSTSVPTGGALGSTVNYSLVPGSDSNSLFQIVTVNGQPVLETNGTLTPNTTYNVLVQSTSTFLLSDVVDLTGVSGPYEYQVSFDPTQLPSSNYEFLAGNAGLISLMSYGPNGWTPAVNANLEFPGTQAKPNYLPQGSYSSFTTANSSATVSNSLGSSGIDPTANIGLGGR